MSYRLSDPITALSGVGPAGEKLYRKLGVRTLGDLVTHYPRRYLDCNDPVFPLSPDEDTPVLIRATVIRKQAGQRLRRGMTVYKASAEADSHRLEIVIFNARYAFEKLKIGEEYLFYGKASARLTYLEMTNPLILSGGTTGLLPIYPLTAGLGQFRLRRDIARALEGLIVPELLPFAVREKQGFLPRKRALQMIHSPASQKEADLARRQLSFEELFVYELALLSQESAAARRAGAVIDRPDLTPFLERLPFTLTDGQRAAISDCLTDMASGRQMHRLIQGDVGCGKTMVAAALTYAAAKAGYQSACMTPTELLARQHLETFQKVLSPLSVRVRLLTGGMTAAEKRAVRQALAAGEVDLVIGTHALLQDATRFARLGLVITDEQHRFGVAQRAALAEKGDAPHLAVMSATPIPRTLALFCYGDLQVSQITELPGGRKSVATYCVSSRLRQRAFALIRKELDQGNAAYLVCPRIEEDGEEALTSVLQYAEQVSKTAFAGYSVGILHGQLKASEKDMIMSAFAAGEIALLIATTVVEVGVDVPRATVMLVENAERYGLSQLHQLRGRVGRGDKPSYCILLSDHDGEQTKRRLQIMTETNDGFKVAEEDLKLRGPGELFGEAQHGLPVFRLGEGAADLALLELTQSAARATLAEGLAAYPALTAAVAELYEKLGQA